METEAQRAERFAQLATGLIRAAIKAGRWKAPISWWGTARGELEGMVTQDLEWLDNQYRQEGAIDLDRFVSKCTADSEPDDEASWHEYAVDLAAAVKP